MIQNIGIIFWQKKLSPFLFKYNKTQLTQLLQNLYTLIDKEKFSVLKINFRFFVRI